VFQRGGSSNKFTESWYRDYLHHIENLCVTVLNTFSKQTISTTANVEIKFGNSYETPDQPDDETFQYL